METGGGITSSDASLITQMGLSALYATRGERLRALAAKSPLADYLFFAAGVVDWQRAWLVDNPLPPSETPAPLPVDWQSPPLAQVEGIKAGYWRTALDDLLNSLAGRLPERLLAKVAAMDEAGKEAAALALLAGDTSLVGADGAPLFWAALSLYWAQWARLRPLDVRQVVGAARDLCPLCGGAPVAAAVVAQPQEGLRYLHCSLCESAWQLVRVQCSACGQSGKLRYWSIEEEKNIQGESCGDCKSYLKLLDQCHDPKLEPLADDLASLALDALVEEQGFARSCLNPFLFPGDDGAGKR
jgi:FdhE protein